MKRIHLAMTAHAVILALFAALAIMATQRHHAPTQAICSTDSDCARFGGNGDPAP